MNVVVEALAVPEVPEKEREEDEEMAKRVEEQEEGEEEAVEAVAVAEVVLQEPAAVGEVTLHSLDYWVIDSGATYSMTPRADLLTELEPSPVKHVTSALGQRAEVKGMGKAMFKGADGKMVGLKNVLWVPNLAANLISVRRVAGVRSRLPRTQGRIYLEEPEPWFQESSDFEALQNVKL
ncbi:unnamed protein product [Closterium sp. NIES-54]